MKSLLNGWIPENLRILRRRMFGPSQVEFEKLGASFSDELSVLRRQLEDVRALSAGEKNFAKQLATFELLAFEHPNIFKTSDATPSLTTPEVSIIMPAWNRCGTINASIRSVQAQTLQDWELIIVDDGSTDGTAAAVASFSHDQRIHYLRQEHAGQCAARNLALGASKAELIAYLDSDNLWYPSYLAGAVAAFSAMPNVDCAYGAAVSSWHGPGFLLFEEFDRDRLLLGNFIDLSTFIHRRRLLTIYGGFDERLKCLEDWDLILRYTEHAKAYRLPFLAVRYREIADNRVSDYQAPWLKDDIATIVAKWTANKPGEISKTST